MTANALSSCGACGAKNTANFPSMALPFVGGRCENPIVKRSGRATPWEARA